ncbi:MAG: hypothetical protein ACK55I_19340, partial [bacterium]
MRNGQLPDEKLFQNILFIWHGRLLLAIPGGLDHLGVGSRVLGGLRRGGPLLFLARKVLQVPVVFRLLRLRRG